MRMLHHKCRAMIALTKSKKSHAANIQRFHRPIELEPITQITPNSSADTSAKSKIPTSSSSCATEETTSTSDVNIAEAEHAHSAAELLLSLASIR